jgi:hypothetical protein
MSSKIQACRGTATVAVALGALTATAATPDEAVCALQQAVACASVTPCERMLPAAVNLPVLLRFELGAGVIESRTQSGETRTSKIAKSATHEDALVLQGEDNGHPWAMRISTENGQFTLTVLRPDEGFVGFGVCSSKILD